MKKTIKANMYETQAILYWILGVVILHLGTWTFFGWLSIACGWITFFWVIAYTAKYSKEMRAEMAD
jgi:uncharacterized membrane protein